MATVDQLPYRPFSERGQVVDGRFRWRLGVRPLDPDDWIEWGADGDAWVAEKADLLDARREQVVALLDGTDQEGAEVRDVLVDHLRSSGRHVVSSDDGPGAGDEPGHGNPSETVVHPLEEAARLVPDDLVLMVERDGRLVCGGGVVCFPNRWDLRSKLGLTMAQVHRPVAELNEQLEAPIGRFLERLRPGRVVSRLGWGLIDSAQGFEPPGPSSPDAGAAPTHVRVERETLRRLPATGCVLFTIRTYLTPLSRLDRDDVTAVEAAVRAMSPGIRAYKDLAGP